MNKETVENSINRKIETYLRENTPYKEILTKLKDTCDNFKRISESDTNLAARKHMISMYIELCNKKIKQINWALENIPTNLFFAGIDDMNIFKLTLLKEKLSQEEELLDY